MCLLGMKMDVNIATGKHNWSISLDAKCKKASYWAPYDFGVTLPKLSNDVSLVTSLTFSDVNKLCKTLLSALELIRHNVFFV